LRCPLKSDDFRELIAETKLRGLLPNQLGHISPPLDARVIRGGWTAHFSCKSAPEESFLNIIGIAPRGSSASEKQIMSI
jgi:hypothetical protein